MELPGSLGLMLAAGALRILPPLTTCKALSKTLGVVLRHWQLTSAGKEFRMQGGGEGVGGGGGSEASTRPVTHHGLRIMLDCLQMSAASSENKPAAQSSSSSQKLRLVFPCCQQMEPPGLPSPPPHPSFLRNTEYNPFTLASTLCTKFTRSAARKI